MAELAKDPNGLELEDLIAAHFASRGCYVEMGVKERSPDEILDLDVVWTDYKRDPLLPLPVEIKSGDWGIGDVFKFYGWTKYLGLQSGQFIHKKPIGRVQPETLEHIKKKTGISFLYLQSNEEAGRHFQELGLDQSCDENLSELWRFSFWIQRRLFKSLSLSIKTGHCKASARKAKEYYQLINSAVFFIPEILERITALLKAHFDHQELAATAAYEIETGNVEFKSPPQSRIFTDAYYGGKHFPVQACLYLAHRARLYILKVLVDYWLSVNERGVKKCIPARFLLPSGMVGALEEMAKAKSFRMFPVFWQTFLFSWGGFIWKDKLEEEYAALEKETGVQRDEIPIALSVFDKLFPIKDGWFRSPSGDARSVLILMPPAMRGVGAFRRLMMANLDKYNELGLSREVLKRMQIDHNSGARILDSAEEDLVN
ncbi:MAG: hypothetical protein IPH91_07600 [Elusimicrobia bacterium]|nr:hypothetical protein [Elusimicrobiota bacterium]MBK7208126.1 hypothetical protein [Elusimicrobiota bacterium]MBK8650274.1 hypothetical protein [Elusimicrobiota bacterium]MBK9056219.1 hypothetical protein [Elusimicrobiota bacterium]